MKFKVTYLIDVVSKNPDDYTVTEIIDANDKIDALKKSAINQTKKDSINIDWINNMEGDLNDIIHELMKCNYCFTNVEEIIV